MFLLTAYIADEMELWPILALLTTILITYYVKSKDVTIDHAHITIYKTKIFIGAQCRYIAIYSTAMNITEQEAMKH